MYSLEVSGKIADRLNEFVNAGAKILLDLDDGTGQFSNGAVACSMDTAFQLIIVDQAVETPDYQLEIKSNVGPVYAKKHSKDILEPQMTLAYQAPFNQLTLNGQGEVLDPNVQIKNLFDKA
ncbi:iron-sulfur cluster biosynthesis family protein [Periweissella fabaria]|uniref:Core domain-containing protein n=1 Tax=Periweissella fabaria TaxID=546157 RepID=A0ABM8Z7V3_9LACO|nr:iron-sulfur cluster biosynthesis family protein [Periweissella fabaria]MCM0597821.1 iron-sulfur cluster biosynthesis family protein [Periweissella fabaria]CAH0417270.1 hypothetical protein WFA24289_01602 [Periweissella fabaria]